MKTRNNSEVQFKTMYAGKFVLEFQNSAGNIQRNHVLWEVIEREIVTYQVDMIQMCIFCHQVNRVSGLVFSFLRLPGFNGRYFIFILILSDFINILISQESTLSLRTNVLTSSFSLVRTWIRWERPSCVSNEPKGSIVSLGNYWINKKCGLKFTM